MKQIVMNSQFNQTRLAVLEDGKLVEFYLEQATNERIVGNVYKGKVADVRPGIQAAFIDIGLEKNAYLYIDDCLRAEQRENVRSKPNIRELVTQGQEILVQVTKEPFGTKGARLSTNISLAGRMLVYLPDDPYIGISRKIASEEERQRLRNICQELCKNSEGVIVRTQAQGTTVEDIAADFNHLRGEWEKVVHTAKETKPRSLLYQDLSLVPKVARDLFNSEVSEWVMDSSVQYRQFIKEIAHSQPALQNRIKLYQSRTSIFDEFGIESELDKALKRNVWLKSGGHIVIDQTEALTAIDVNTGKFTGSFNHEDTVFKTNLEAAAEIARQLRLRDIGGIIIIDFIDMTTDANRETVLRHLSEHLKKDRTTSHILGFTALGLLEMTRKKVKQNILDRLTRPCTCCDGRGKIFSEETVLSKMIREIQEYANNQDYKAFLLDLHPHIMNYIKENQTELVKNMENEWGIKLFLRPNEKIPQDRYHMVFLGSLEEVKQRL